jgi:hypothetical protein
MPTPRGRPKFFVLRDPVLCSLYPSITGQMVDAEKDDRILMTVHLGGILHRTILLT